MSRNERRFTGSVLARHCRPVFVTAEGTAGAIGALAGDRSLADGGLVRPAVWWFADRVRLIGEEAFEMADANEICRMDTVTLAGRIKARELSPVEVVEAVLGRLERLDPVLHAFAAVTAEQARAEARRIEQDIAAGREVGPLAGVRTGVKDLICTKGVRTASGSYAYADFVRDEDDVVVERIKAAGAVVIGKTQVPEFGYSGTGQTPLAEPTANPWRLDRTSGGSSAGSGAAVATGIGPFSLGSDGGGSVRIPASFCGLCGVKATMGRVPLYPGTKDERYPGVSSWESLEHIGPLTRTVADAALVLSVIAGPDDRDRLGLPAADFDWRAAAEGSIRGMRVAYSPDLGYAAVDPEVRQIADRAAQVFERDLGCTVERADPGWPDPYEAFLGLVINESDLAGLRKLAGSLGDRMSPHLAELMRAEWTAEQLTSAVMGRRRSTTRRGGSSAPSTCCSRRPWPCRPSSTASRVRPRSAGARWSRSTGCRSRSRST
jgi:aspartyl-tRNA(Asn)/glutamyl-tRNA(Gln) amidotransferase subunit A